MVKDFSVGTQPVNVVVAGGCHVIGYPVGEEWSFPSLLQGSLADGEVVTAVHRMAYVKISHISKIVAKCREVQPDVLVLQVGHFELGKRLSVYLRARLGLAEAQTSRESSGSKAGSVKSPWLLYFKARCKMLLDFCLGHPLVDFRQMEDQLRALCRAVSALQIPLVVLLSPLPCADPFALYYRRSSCWLFERIAREHEIEFINVLEDLPEKRRARFGTEEFHYDAVHLGQEGHLAVARVLTGRLQASLRQCRVREIAK